jgi:hypothetical protein
MRQGENMTPWKHHLNLDENVKDAAADNPENIPAFLVMLAGAVESLGDADFGEELRDAAEESQYLDDALENADYWLSQFYDWCDNTRTWVQFA